MQFDFAFTHNRDCTNAILNQFNFAFVQFKHKYDHKLQHKTKTITQRLCGETDEGSCEGSGTSGLGCDNSTINDTGKTLRHKDVVPAREVAG